MGWQPGSRWDHSSSRRPEGTHEASVPAASLLKTRGPRAPPHPWSHLQPGPEPSLQTPLPRFAVTAGWTQRGGGGGRSTRAVGPASSGRRTRLPWGRAGLAVSEALRPLASDSSTVSPPRCLQVLSCIPERKLYPSWNTDQRTCGIKAAHLMACLKRLHCFLLTPCDRAQRSVGILFEKNLLSSK